jgi:hypothetical protein
MTSLALDSADVAVRSHQVVDSQGLPLRVDHMVIGNARLE